MTIYLLLLVIIILLGSAKYFLYTEKYCKYFDIIIIALLIFFIGARNEVGGDWENYLLQYNEFKNVGFPSVNLFTSSDPIYIIINILSYKIGTGYVGTNIICATIFYFGFYKLTKEYKNTLLSLIVVFLPLAIIVSAGYTRQSVSLGFLFFFIHYFIEKRYILSCTFVALSVLSHKSVTFFILFFFIIFSANLIKNNKDDIKKIIQNNLKVILLSATFIFPLVFYVLQSDISRLLNIYVTTENQYPVSTSIKQIITSAGLIFKYPFTLLVSFTYYIFRKKFNFKNNNEIIIFDTFFILNLAVMPFLGFFSLLIDRLLVFTYIFPALIVGKFFGIIKKKYELLLYLLISICAIFFTIVWFKFANHSQHWIPYKNSIINLKNF
tara:strand:+ start:1707 stop:2849 length:1143 start_codon:yes stop_codon:yes gene_type:complete